MTTTLPDNVPSYIYGSDAGPDQWYYDGKSLCHNRRGTKFPDLPSLYELRTQQRIGIQITENGELNIFIDGNYMKTVASGLPVHQAIFGVVDVRSICTKIKSEILSGELDGVCMDVCTCINTFLMGLFEVHIQWWTQGGFFGCSGNPLFDKTSCGYIRAR